MKNDSGIISKHNNMNLFILGGRLLMYKKETVECVAKSERNLVKKNQQVPKSDPLDTLVTLKLLQLHHTW